MAMQITLSMMSKICAAIYGALCAIRDTFLIGIFNYKAAKVE
jgi:hypothetical protein